jgi:hypothetical protein
MSPRTNVETPAGGVELYRMLRSVAEEYRLRAVACHDYDAGAVALALEALVLAAARAGVHVHMQVGPEGGT